MTIKRTTVGETSRIEVIMLSSRGAERGREYRMICKRTGYHLTISTDELFDLAEELDDICDEIEDKETKRGKR